LTYSFGINYVVGGGGRREGRERKRKKERASEKESERIHRDNYVQ
jgi:hypothetical protein